MAAMKMRYELKTRFQPENVDVDIVAVQGLWADPEWTWKKGGVSWLADLLPLDVPTAHTMTFGPAASPSRPLSKFSRQIFYRSKYIFLDIFMLGLLVLAAQCHLWRTLAFMSSAAIAAIALLPAILCLKKYLVYLRTTPLTEIHNQAIMLLAELLNLHRVERDPIPVILIGHSFGGLIIKQAMVIAEKDPQFTTIAMLFRGIIFLGTPHRGARLATAAKYCWFQPASDIRALLEIDSKTLTDLDESFLRLPTIQTSKNIYCFFEQKSTVYFFHLSMITVDKSSATWSDRPAEGLSREHSDLNKYENHDDPDFQRISKTIQKILENL